MKKTLLALFASTTLSVAAAPAEFSDSWSGTINGVTIEINVKTKVDQRLGRLFDFSFSGEKVVPGASASSTDLSMSVRSLKNSLLNSLLKSAEADIVIPEECTLTDPTDIAGTRSQFDLLKATLNSL